MPTILIHHADCIVTMDATRREIKDGAILVRDNIIEWVGSAEELPLEALSANYGINARGRIVLPGFVNIWHWPAQGEPASTSRFVKRVDKAQAL